MLCFFTRLDRGERPLIALGIESTAHTFSVGLVSDDGTVISLVGDTYFPPEGGLHPAKTAEHHVSCFKKIIEDALEQGSLGLDEVDLIAFSQGPGLGPCLRVGATIARTLHLWLGVPLVGVNHCVAHVEIGRMACQVEDPLTVYVSGGNTIVSAYDCGKYQVFGETLDIALGNMLDTFALRAGLHHPGGPIIEALAKKASNYLELPYTVKGMDLAFSGLLTAALKKLKEPGVSLEDVAFSLQETAFAMLGEVSERALAHTGKSDVLLTGGVAANSRLKKMLEEISKDHGASFHAVPRKLAGDNGAMIAWNGILALKFGQGGLSLKQSHVKPRWRLDQVPVPWREVGSR